MVARVDEPGVRRKGYKVGGGWLACLEGSTDTGRVWWVVTGGRRGLKEEGRKSEPSVSIEQGRAPTYPGTLISRSRMTAVLAIGRRRYVRTKRVKKLVVDVAAQSRSNRGFPPSVPS